MKKRGRASKKVISRRYKRSPKSPDFGILTTGVVGLLSKPSNQFRDNGEKYSTCDHASQLTGGICTHGVHQNEIIRIFVICDFRGEASCHGKGRDARGADQRIDLVAAENCH